jgi:hypothetical protein
MKMGKAYRLDRLEDDLFNLVIEIETLPGVSRRVFFEMLDKHDLLANGFEVPR